MKNLFKISKKTKNILLIICYIFILPISLIYLVCKVFIYIINKDEKTFDNYMFDLIKYKIVNHKKEYIKTCLYYESILFYNSSKRYFRIIITIFIITIILLSVFKIPYRDFLRFTFDTFPIVKWITVKDINESIFTKNLLNLPEGMIVSFIPLIFLKKSSFSFPLSYLSILYFLISSFYCIMIFRCILCSGGRIKRSFIIYKKLYKEKKINNLSYMSSYSLSINSRLPNQSKYEISKE